MHIKQVIIEGFKSYREEIATEPFSPKINCVVGANGSGKTNFFHAIRFVLIDLFHNLCSEDRHSLLHEGAGHQVLSAFVEIVFDNSDNRIPVDHKEEVHLRRTIGVKKDEYFFDGKRITKTEVMNLLESVGFSRSNPYYVVQQGKIASLTLMKDSERLDLLKEIGGTRVYEERRRESLKIMQETGNKRRQIIQVVQYLDERLKELDEEKKELRKYQQLDMQRKSLEYAIYDKELRDADQKLTEVEEARTKVSEKSAETYNSVLATHQKLNELEKKIKELTKELQILNKEKEAVEKLRTEAMKKCTQMELDNKDVEERISLNKRAKEFATQQLETLQKEIHDSNKDLANITPLYDQKIEEEHDISREIAEREKKLSILYQKQGRATQFSDKAARDTWLQKEIYELKRVLSSNMAQELKLRDEILQLNTELERQDLFIEDRRKDIAALQSRISESREGFLVQKARRDELQDERKSLWGKESALIADLDKLKAEVVKAEKSLDHVIPCDIRRGLNSVRRICDNYDIAGVHGAVFELLECDDKFFNAVEVTAGNSLFHVVVDTDEISTQIIRHLNAQKGGRVTFIPLNRVMAPQVTFSQGSDADSLLEKLRFSLIFEPAFRQVFGRTVVCTDLDVATKVAHNEGLDCVTLAGDQVSKKGGMTGGFYDSRRSKLKYMNIVKQNKKSINLKKEELDEVIHQLDEVDRKITQLITELQKIDAEQGHDRSVLEQYKQDIVNANKQNQSIFKALARKENMLSDAQSQIELLRTSINMKEDEMGTDLIDHLTAEEKDLLSRLNPEITDLKEKLVACRMERLEIETRKAELETNLTTNLVRRKLELEVIVSSEDNDALQLQAEAALKKQELKDAKLLVSDLTQQFRRGLSDSIDERTKKLSGYKKVKNHLKSSEEMNERSLQEEAKELGQLLNKRNLLLAKLEEHSKKIRELGPLSADAFETYKRKSIKELYNMLHKCNEQLQQFSHVNKKALDQYVNFTEQREELQRRQAELDASDEKIKELITVLDQRKDESIERTFKGVVKHFKDVFAELVPGGHGTLTMLKKKNGHHVVDEEVETGGRVEKYIGVKVKVCFTGQGETTQSMKQLSGGQKTVVALTLIFAIQRCDPAPFYLFDEIDAALDHQYRTAVANMIRRQADVENTQFITTTFRPELVKVADKIYAVSHKNRVSHLSVVSNDPALEFIQQDQSHN
ncbi:unnamed protein product [Rhodiola kirilowii]